MNKHYKVIVEIILDIEADDRNQAIRAAKGWNGEGLCTCMGTDNYSLEWNSKPRVKSAKWIRNE